MIIGAQLYTIRDFLKTPEEIEDSFKKLQKLGFKYVQLSGNGPIEAEKVNYLSEKYDQKIVITHINPDRIINDTQNVIAEHKTFGCTNIGIGAMPQKYWHSLEGAKQFLKDFELASKTLHENGMLLNYHNHAFEFEKYDGKVIFDYLVEETKPELFGFIPDVYWIQVGGRCPAKQLKMLKDRVQVCHYKDLKIVNSEQKMSTVMDGNLCWDEIFEATEFANIPYAMIEQDDVGEQNPFDALAQSFNNLNTVLGK